MNHPNMISIIKKMFHRRLGNGEQAKNNGVSNRSQTNAAFSGSFTIQ